MIYINLTKLLLEIAEFLQFEDFLLSLKKGIYELPIKGTD